MCDPRVMELLEQLLETGQTPREVCVECPDLVHEVEQRLRLCADVDAAVEALFPLTNGELGNGPVDLNPDLPRVPGYEIESVLGRGGMGVVYKARQLGLNRTEALKMLPGGGHARQTDLARFRREAEAIASLRHANVVQIHTVGELNGRPYFAMEYVEGGSLAQMLDGTPLPAAQASRLVQLLAEAVHAAHAVGIVHRDLKPGNILLTADGAPKISDFGLARHFGQDQDLTLSGARVGTPSYMSPEQAAGQASAVEPASDIYSLGAILYELLTGRPPFRGETSAATVLQVLHQEPVAPSQLNGRVPRDLETICLKCLQKDPRRRYATASALADDMRRFRSGEPILARPVGRPERAIKWVRRRPAAAAATAAGLLLAAALTAVTLSWAVRRATAARLVDTYLEQVAERERASDWAAARAALWRGKAWSEDRGPPRERQRVRDAERELDLVDALAAIRSDRAFATRPHFNTPDVDRQYQDAFRKAGIGTIDEPAATVADRIKASPARAAIVAALDDWAFCFNNAPRRLWLLEAARDADPDPWRDRVRNPHNWQNPDVLNQLAGNADLREESVSLLLVLAGLLDFNRVDAVPFHRWIQAAHPDDFWANFVLAEFLDEHRDDDAVGFYRAALALRPNSAAANVNLAMSLQERGRKDEAADYWIRALDLAPNAPMVHHNVAIALLNDGQTDAAIREFRQTLKLDPQFPPAHAALGHALLVKGRVVDAKSELRRALELLPPTHLLRAQVNKDLSETTIADNGPGHGGHD